MRKHSWNEELTQHALACYHNGMGIPEILNELQKLGFSSGAKAVYNHLKRLGIKFRSNDSAQKSRALRPKTVRICEKCASEFLGIKTGPRWCKICCPNRKARNLLECYNLSFPEYEAMFVAQNRNCVLCTREAEVVDHCHKTGRVRGILCYGCNTALGRFEEHGWAEKAALYV